MSGVITAQAGDGAPSSRIIGSPLKPSINAIQDAWEEILNTVKGKRRVAWMLLSNATPKNLTNDVLTLEFPRDGDAKGFLVSGHKKVLTDAILDVSGVRVRIVPTIQSGASPGTHSADDTSKELTGMELIQRELGEQVTGEPPSGYSDEPPF